VIYDIAAGAECDSEESACQGKRDGATHGRFLGFAGKRDHNMS